ncbi:MAG: sulfotransferase [Pyrinomonadaceae bacterium]
MDRLIEGRGAALEGWIPIRLYWRDDQPIVDWCYLGRNVFEDSFFEQTIGKLLAKPFNMLFRHQTPIEVLGQWSEVSPGLKPTGFVFHLSRSGSTLVSRMLAALPTSVVISEARPIDSTLRAHFHSREVTDDDRIKWLRWMVSALAQRRRGDEKHFFMKFDAWNMPELPLIRRAFPEVPWIFVYRDPVEVLVSQMSQRGAHMVPGVIDPSLFGMRSSEITTIKPEDYCARVLAAICEAALQNHRYGGRLINYTQLPEVVWTSVMSFFGVACQPEEIEAMQMAARRDAKNPVAVFSSDTIRKKQKATGNILAAAEQWVYPVYQRLEAARQGSGGNLV